MLICSSSVPDPDQTCTSRLHISVQPVTVVRNLGIYLDGDVSMCTHVTTTVRACFTILRQIRNVHRSLPRPAMLTLLRSLVINKLDFCGSVMAAVHLTSCYSDSLVSP